MKKCAYILLTTLISFSTTCMEKERQKTDVFNIQTEPSIALQPNSPLLQFNTLNNLLKTNPLPVHTVRKQYSDIGFDFVPVYIQTNTNESSNTNEIELTPIYRPITGSKTEYLDCITNTKKTAPLSPEQKYLTERLYNSAREVVDFITSKHKMTKNDLVLTLNKKYITLIELMIAAKKKDTTEDFMSKFAYEKGDDHRISFAFNCLKKYLLTIHDSKEKSPSNADSFSIRHNKITQTLTTTCKEYISTPEHITIPNYPTYEALWGSMIYMINNGVKWAIPYLYTSTNIFTTEYPQYSHITDINKCFDILYSHEFSPYDVYNSLNLIEQMKKLTHITKEKELGYKFLTFEKKQTYKENFLWWRSKVDFEKQKNITALLFSFVEKYHKDRGNKITPNHRQVWIYHLLQHIALPDSFDTKLVDKSHYALEESYKLSIDIETLSKKNPEELQNLVDQHYIFNEQ